MRITDLLHLGRVSNLPTVWSNVLAALGLSGVAPLDVRLSLLLISLSLFYLAGMALNDAFDADYDAIHRPERPIPSGRLLRRWVFGLGFGLLAAAMLLLFIAGQIGGMGVPSLVAGNALAASIVFYDWRHKGCWYSPIVMGATRSLVYLSVGLVYLGEMPPLLLFGALALMSYIVGLTYVAGQENLAQFSQAWPLAFLLAASLYLGRVALDQPWALWIWLAWNGWMLSALYLLVRSRTGDIGRAVSRLIAGVALLDAVLLAGVGELGFALVALGCFGVSLVLQREISAT